MVDQHDERLHPVAKSRRDQVVVLFPGQGSRARDMRERVERWCPELGEATFAALGADPFSRMGDGTAYEQPAIFCASLAGWHAIRQALEPAAVLGHSLGEFAALVAAGSLDPFDALGLVIRRGRAMQEAEQRQRGGMIAVSGPRLEELEELAARCGVVIANDNAPDQVVLSGPTEAVECALAEAHASGLLAVRLPVSGAFHSPLMAQAGEEFGAAIAAVEIGSPKLLALCTTTCAPYVDIKRELTLGITRPVLWRGSLERLCGTGFRRFAETGPGKVLSKLARRTCGGRIEIVNVDDAP